MKKEKAPHYICKYCQLPFQNILNQFMKTPIGINEMLKNI